MVDATVFLTSEPLSRQMQSGLLDLRTHVTSKDALGILSAAQAHALQAIPLGQNFRVDLASGLTFDFVDEVSSDQFCRPDPCLYFGGNAEITDDDGIKLLFGSAACIVQCVPSSVKWALKVFYPSHHAESYFLTRVRAVVESLSETQRDWLRDIYYIGKECLLSRKNHFVITADDKSLNLDYPPCIPVSERCYPSSLMDLLRRLEHSMACKFGISGLPVVYCGDQWYLLEFRYAQDHIVIRIRMLNVQV